MWFGWLAALGAAGLLTGCRPDGPGLLREGARLIEEGKHAAAARQLELARDQLPQAAIVWNHLGVAYHGAGRSAEALQAYTQALALDRNLAAARFNLGSLHFELGQFTAAVSEWTSFTGLQPKSVEGWLALADAQTRARSPEGAERSLQAVLKLDPTNADAWNRLGLLHWNRRRTRDAQTAFETALRHQPDCAPALLNLAVLHHTPPGDRATAAAFYQRYLAITPRRYDYEAVRETSRRLEAELAPASRPVPAASLAPVLTPATNPPALSRVGQSKADPAPKTAPTTTIVTAERKPAEAKAATATTPRPADAVVRPVSAPPTSVGAPKLEVVQLAPEAAIKPASTAPNAPAPASVRTAKNTTSVPPAPKATGLPTPVPRVSEPERPTLLQRANPFRWFNRDPEPPPVRSGSEVEVAAARPVEAQVGQSPASPSRAPTRYAYERPPTPRAGNHADAERHFARGVREQRDGRATQAITEYLAAVQADPAYFEANYNLGLAAFEAGHLSRSLSAYERALSIKPTDSGARFNFALALQKAGHARDAANELETLLAGRPDETRAHLTLANLYAQSLGQPARARPHYLQVLEAQPRHPQATAIRQWLETHP